MPSLAERPRVTEQYRDASNLNARIALHDRFSTNPYGWQRWVWDQLDLPAGSRVLELGCGPGNLWAENLDRAPSAWEKFPSADAAPAGRRITLTDLSPGMVQQARHNLGRFQEHFYLVVADALTLPFPTAAFDIAIANHMLYHVPDRSQALHEIRRVLRPGGRLYATTAGQKHLRELEEMVLALVPEIAPDRLRIDNPFTLESGGDQLATCFAHVTVRRYEDSLRVTAAEPLVAYILSAQTWAPFVRDKADRLTRLVQEHLAADGLVRVTKDSGLFIAW
jgi:SAM-dependent methyltransferase